MFCCTLEAQPLVHVVQEGNRRSRRRRGWRVSPDQHAEDAHTIMIVLDCGRHRLPTSPANYFDRKDNQGRQCEQTPSASSNNDDHLRRPGRGVDDDSCNKWGDVVMLLLSLWLWW